MSNVNPTIKWKKSVVEYVANETLYLSIPFTWLVPRAKKIADKWRRTNARGRVVVGGPAAQLVPIDWAKVGKRCPFDALAMHNPEATFTTRGCPNSCAFCAVPKIEGHFRELRTWKPARIICDNCLNAASKKHFKKVVDSLIPFKEPDFNQGMKARLFMPWHAEQISRLHRPMVRFAFDHVNDESALMNALEIARAAGLKRFGVYVLIGFNDSPVDARYRLEKVRSLGIRPTPMRYQPLDCLKKNSYVGPGWTDRLLRNMTRYYSCLRWLEHIPFEDYDHTITNRK